MTSIIEGYNYDIFISYRQKDNKFDGWVTKFVDDLKKELEATFKEDISIYFDENPHDGLLEMHNVDKSLEGKLKSLIFIPIISQTYCDTKSFAWQNEFCAFNRIAKEDQFGRDIKLSGGNVTSRILPVKINDLDPEDKELVEKELGGVLRPIEFIYKEPGVNRPLTPDDDERKNLNNTRYRNQINKVANTVKGIIRAMKDPHSKTDTEITERVRVEKGGGKSKITKIYITASIIIILLIAGIFTIPALVKKRSALSESITDKSIAVLPFTNLSNDPEQEYFTDGMLEERLDRLFKIGDLKVTSRTSSVRFKDSTLPLKDIAHELGVSTILEGSVRKIENNVRITVQLIDARSDTHLWSDVFDVDLTDLSHIFSIQSEVAQLIADKLHAVITPQEKQLIEKIPTENLEAYEAYLKGQFYLNKFTPDALDSAQHYFELAKNIDPDYIFAHLGISGVWTYRQQWGLVTPAEGNPKSMEALMKAYDLDSNNAVVQSTLAAKKVWGMFEWAGGEACFKRSISLNPNDAMTRAAYSHLLNILGRPEEALEQIDIGLKLDPMNPFIITFYGVDLFMARKYDEAIKAYTAALNLAPDYPFALTNLWQAYLADGQTEKAYDYLKSFWSLVDPECGKALEAGYLKDGFKGALLSLTDRLIELWTNNPNQFFAPFDLAILYAEAHDIEKSIYWLEQSYNIKDPNLPYLLLPSIDILRDDPRFQNLCQKMNLPYKPKI